MNALDRRRFARMCRFNGVTVEHNPKLCYAWAVFVDGEPVMRSPEMRYMWLQDRFTSKMAAIRCGVAYAKKKKRGAA